MTTALLVCAPRLGYRFLFIAFFVAAYPLWHADFPTVVVHHEVEIPAVAAPSVERSIAAPERLGSCR